MNLTRALRLQQQFDGLLREALVMDLPIDAIPPPMDGTRKVWRDVMRRCRYANDGTVDTWQTPGTTWRRRLGDCEDFALLAAAMLKSGPYRLELVVGRIEHLTVSNPWHAALHVDALWVLDTWYAAAGVPVILEDCRTWKPVWFWDLRKMEWK